MKHDFAYYVSKYFSKYLINERGYSENTLSSYKYSFVQLITFFNEQKKVKTEKIEIEDFNKKLVLDFLDWLQSEKQNNINSRNYRLATLRSFFKYVRDENIEFLSIAQEILSIRFKKGTKLPYNYLSTDGIKLLLAQPDQTTKKGRRDLTLISLLYDAAMRVQELIDLTPSSFNFEKKTPSVLIKGKGKSIRSLPMVKDQIEHLQRHLKENNLHLPENNLKPLFTNNQGQKFTRAGILNIIKKYTKFAHIENPEIIPERLSCHSLRHSKATHLSQEGIPLYQIQYFLGHHSIQSTQIYVHANPEQVKSSLVNAYKNFGPEVNPTWKENDILLFLAQFK